VCVCACVCLHILYAQNSESCARVPRLVGDVCVIMCMCVCVCVCVCVFTYTVRTKFRILR